MCLWSLSFWVEDPRLERLGFRVMSGHQVTGSPGHVEYSHAGLRDTFAECPAPGQHSAETLQQWSGMMGRVRKIEKDIERHAKK